ncbi:hypothetical protein N7478_012851 [Penicillium angulare]|uniref:uncharacterized protein n=1 Tax=Penicillium angulare TaxID=116970 RepID=UPI002542083C|nr:uncharacterized protein N7478_012851 [Penicillium angulare]KAJ5256747.1 hypothetical protein N7478_012851 [Penicillium angulare]
MAHLRDRSHRKVTGAPDYDTPEFWDARFAQGQDVGEWLNPGQVLIDEVLSNLENRSRTSSGGQRKPHVLHLGPGVSQLGSKLREACLDRGWRANGIVNVDFSSEAIRIGQTFENLRPPTEAMNWHRADLLAWNDVANLLPYAPFDVILDKSTSDAIATSTDQSMEATDDISHICPTVQHLLATDYKINLSPVELLALHLVPLAQRGTAWIVLSYSTFRFDNLPYLAKYWTLHSRTPLKAPTGPVSSSTYTPDIFHWVYILIRK